MPATLGVSPTRRVWWDLKCPGEGASVVPCCQGTGEHIERNRLKKPLFSAGIRYRHSTGGLKSLEPAGPLQQMYYGAAFLSDFARIYL